MSASRWGRAWAWLRLCDERWRTEGPSAVETRRLGAFFMGALLLWTIAKLPVGGRFQLYVYLDYGSNLTAQELLDRGARPTVDFFYCYALLPLALARVWFAVLGRTAWSYLAAVAAFQAVIGWGLARFARFGRIGLVGVGLIAAALPFMVPPTYPNVAHGLESALLAWALGEHAGGRRDRALALLTAAAFTKPSMAYVYGAILVLTILIEARGRPSGWLRVMAPAAFVGLALAVLLGTWFGPVAVIRSQLPFEMARLYSTVGYGFFHGTGQRFWLPEGATWRHYLGTPRGFWIVATGVLTWASLWALVRRLRQGPGPASRQTEVVLTCAVLHWVYICCFFGGESSWTYYANVLVLGCTLLATWGRAGRWFVVVLALLALSADRSLPREVAREWSEVGVRPRLHGLWATDQEVVEWRRLLERIGTRRAVFLCSAGCAPTFAPESFEPAVTLFLITGMENSLDARRTADQIRGADLVVVPSRNLLEARFRDFLTEDCPEIRSALDLFPRVTHGAIYDVHERD